MGSTIAVGILLLLIAAILFLPLWNSRRRRGLTSQLVRYQTITEALLRGDLPRAREELKEIIRADTEDVGAYLRLISILEQEGDLERAVALRRSLLARKIDSRELKLEIYSGLINGLLRSKRSAEAVPLVEKLRLLDRKSPLVPLVGMHAALEKKEWEKALRSLDSLRRADGNAHRREAPRVRSWIARAKAQEGDLRAARKLLEDALKVNPGYAPAGLLLGDLWAQEEEHERAARVWTELLRHCPEATAQLVGRLEKAYFELGRFGDLEKLFEEFIAGPTQHAATLRVALARMALRKGEPARGLALVEETLQRKPQDNAAQCWYLHLLEEAGRHDEVRASLKKATEASVSSAEEIHCPQCAKATQATSIRCPACGSWLPNPTGAAAEPATLESGDGAG